MSNPIALPPAGLPAFALDKKPEFFFSLSAVATIDSVTRTITPADNIAVLPGSPADDTEYLVGACYVVGAENDILTSATDTTAHIDIFKVGDKPAGFRVRVEKTGTAPSEGRYLAVLEWRRYTTSSSWVVIARASAAFWWGEDALSLLIHAAFGQQSFDLAQSAIKLFPATAAPATNPSPLGAWTLKKPGSNNSLANVNSLGEASIRQTFLKP